VTRDHGATREHRRAGLVAADSEHRTADDRQGGDGGDRVPAGIHRALQQAAMCHEEEYYIVYAVNSSQTKNISKSAEKIFTQYSSGII